MKRKVLQPLLYDNKRYEPGDSVEMDNATAKPLIEAGVLAGSEKTESGGKDAASGSAGGGELTQEQRDAKIRKALQEMLTEDPKQGSDMLWTKDKKPRNKVVDNRTELEVKNEEIEPIWEELKPKEE